MKSILFLVMGLAIIIIIGFSILKGCSGFVSNFDDEKSERMISLINNYYYGIVDTTIWMKEEATESFKRILPDKIDSLIWNDEIIIGHVAGRYCLLILLLKE